MNINLTSSEHDLVDKFKSLKNGEDVADILEISFHQLKYYLYILKENKRYYKFTIHKKSGGDRNILAPTPGLKIIQRKLAYIFNLIYHPAVTAHGFIAGRSIVSNAKMHLKKSNVLNIDIKDFFPSLNFGRVRGLFLHWPYDLVPPVATIIANVCCYDNHLPQGAPTSPIISNMICAKMDSQLRVLAKEYRCIYTRYVDDITFSTTIRDFPDSLAVILPDGEIQIGESLNKILKQNGFEINFQKVRLQTKYQKQEVTGIKVNEFPNVSRKFVRQIRAMLHDWETKGYEIAEQRHYEKFDLNNRPNFKPQPPFYKIVKGKIDYLGMVKGKQDPNYLKFLYKYARLNPNYQLNLEKLRVVSPDKINVQLFTEGETDWKHLKAALRNFNAQGKFHELAITFWETDDPIGADKLVSMCNAYSVTPEPHPNVRFFLFDKDRNDILSKVHIKESGFHDFGSNVIAITLPTPQHRMNCVGLCIELLYFDKDIMRKKNNRRLFLSNEFNVNSGRHNKENLVYSSPKKLKGNDFLQIIDSDVYDVTNHNVALPKSDFAKSILDQDEGFNDIDFSGFEGLFTLMSKLALAK